MNTCRENVEVICTTEQTEDLEQLFGNSTVQKGMHHLICSRTNPNEKECATFSEKKNVQAISRMYFLPNNKIS